MNRYTYCANNPIRYYDPTGHWGVEVHGKKTSEILKVELNKYIKEESKNIIVYKTDKKGNISVDKKGNQIVDEKKTKTERDTWVKEQNKKVDGYVKAIVAGNLYVDQESTVFQRKDFESDSIFHGITTMYIQKVKEERKDKKYTLFVEERRQTAMSILTSPDIYKKEGAIKKFIVDPGVNMLKDNTKALDTSKASIEKDIEKGKFHNGKATTYLFGEVRKDGKVVEEATKESASLFVLGMGLHSLQDQQAHGNLKSSSDHNDEYNDIPKYDSWGYDESKGKIVVTEGNKRITKTVADTRSYIKDFLYGDSSTPGCGSFLFEPNKYSLTNQK